MPHSFATTRWSVVLRAGTQTDSGGRRALSDLCQVYWPVVHAYVRRRGYDPENAKDLTQGFFAQLLEKNYLKHADPERGRFRSFLLSSVKNYLSNEWDRQQAQKRGGGSMTLSLDFESYEGKYNVEPADKADPAKLFERAWALTLLDRVLMRLQTEVSASTAKDYFHELKPYLTGENPDAPLKEVAKRLGLTESTLKSRIHRMRRRFGELMREEVGDTLDDPRQIPDEISFLFKALN